MREKRHSTFAARGLAGYLPSDGAGVSAPALVCRGPGVAFCGAGCADFAAGACGRGGSAGCAVLDDGDGRGSGAVPEAGRAGCAAAFPGAGTGPLFWTGVIKPEFGGKRGSAPRSTGGALARVLVPPVAGAGAAEGLTAAAAALPDPQPHLPPPLAPQPPPPLPQPDDPDPLQVAQTGTSLFSAPCSCALNPRKARANTAA